jgi:23S rRNA (uracil1939-C5)-methyltransferase
VTDDIEIVTYPDDGDDDYGDMGTVAEIEETAEGGDADADDAGGIEIAWETDTGSPPAERPTVAPTLARTTEPPTPFDSDDAEPAAKPIKVDKLKNAPRLRTTVERVVVGGDGLARDADGRVVFVEGGLPGETVNVRIVQQKKGFARSVLESIENASAIREEPPCRYVAAGCGGCTFQHVTPDGQRDLKVDMVRDALRRQGGIPNALVHATVALPADAYRTTVRVLIRDHRPAFRRRHGNEAVSIDNCYVAHPLVDELLHDGKFYGASEVQIRVGARTGERLVLAHPSGDALVLPDDVIRIDSHQLANGNRAHFHEMVAGRTWHIESRAFFQARPDGADALVELVRAAAVDAPSILDLYGGVGLLGGSVAAQTKAKLTMVEGNGDAIRSARVNLEDLDAHVVRRDVVEYRGAPHDLVIADPSRAGLGVEGVASVVHAKPNRVVLVSCDAAALGRDARLLGEAGFALTHATPVDLFPHTVHVEVVSVFDRQ